MIDCPSDIGFSSVSTLRSPWPAGRRKRSSSAGLGEAPADDLVQAAAGERVLGGAAHPLCVREPSRRTAPRGQRRGEALEAVDPRDLLDQVDLARHVAPPHRGNRHVEPVGRIRDAEVERPQDLHLASRARPARRGSRTRAPRAGG